MHKHAAMQPWSDEFIPAPVSAPSSSYMYNSNFRLYRLFACETFIAVGGMAPTPTKSWSPMVPPWLRQRAQSGQHPQQLEVSTTTPRLQRSLSAASLPTTPSSPADGTERLQTSPTDHVRRLPARLSSLIRRRPAEERTNQSSKASQPQYAAYSPNPASTAPRSAPSVITSFPADQASTPPTPQAIYQQHLTASPSTYGISHSNPVSTTTLSASTSNDALEGIALAAGPRSRSATSIALSPITASQPSSTIAESVRESISSSDPNQLQRSSDGTATPASHESEATDAFSSPSEYALFVEATSSLSIDDATAAPIERRSISGSQTTPARFAASFPPVSQANDAQLLSQPSMASAQPRAQSLPPQHAPIHTLAGRQNRSQIVAEALLGLEHDADEHNSDDELPDYATSQMEAHARQRWEATQRARELDEAWRRRRIRE